jgi:hypothetical protein
MQRGDSDHGISAKHFSDGQADRKRLRKGMSIALADLILGMRFSKTRNQETARLRRHLSLRSFLRTFIFDAARW